MNKNKDKNNKKKTPFAVLRKGVVTACLGVSLLFGSAFMLAGCGERGPQGEQGVAGATWYSGAENPTTTLGKVGDFYFETDVGNVWQYTNNGWVVISNLKGEQGEQGGTGQPGTNSYTYIAYASDTNGTGFSTTYSDGLNYIGVLVSNTEITTLTASHFADKWVKFVGQDGSNGRDGATWLTGTAITGTGTGISAIITNSKVGDLYLNTDTCDIYQCTAENTWNWIANIKGETGETGPTGPQGPAGEDGTSVYVGYDGYIWQGTTKTEYKVVGFELGADVIENTVGIETMSAFESGYIDTSIAQIALMGYYQQETNLTIYGNSLVKNITVYAEEEGTLEIGTAKVADVVSARTNGSSLTLTNTSSYELTAGKNTVPVDLSVADDETIILGGTNSNVSLYYAQGINLEDNQGLFTTINGNSNTEIYSQTNDIKNKLYVQVEATYDLSFTTQAFTDIETFISGLSQQTTLAQTQNAVSNLYPLFYNENASYKNSQIMEVTIPVIEVSSLTEDQTITMYVADNSVLSSTDVQTFIASENCKTYTLTIPSSMFSDASSTKISRFITLDVSSLNIFVGENEVIGFGSTTDNLSKWGIISHRQTTNPELYLSYATSNTTMANGGGSYSLLFNFTIKRGTESTFEDRIEDITTRNNEVVVANVLKGKNVSILGDSISTYKGYSNDSTNTNSTIGSNAVYGNYQPTGSYDIAVEDTWWMQTIQNNEMNLLVNNSWSGSSTVGELTSSEAGCGTRTENLHDNTGENTGTNPDIIAVYMGTNDLGKTVGDYTTEGFYDNLYVDADEDGNYDAPTTFAHAYAIMLDRMTKAYPDADIFCFTILANNWVDSTNNENINNAIKAIAEHYGATVVDIYTETGITSENAADYMLSAETSHIHPNAAGMDLITEVFENALLEKYSKK